LQILKHLFGAAAANGKAEPSSSCRKPAIPSLISAVNRQGALEGAALVLCGLCSLYGWLGTASEFLRNPFQDWAVFHAAAVGYRHFGSWQAIFANWSMPDHPWLYPPSFLLLLLPLGGLSFDAGCAVFLGITLLALVGALWCFAGERRWLLLIAVVLSPAAMVNFYLGQNAFLTGALFFGGTLALRRQPLLAGTLLGVLTYKPQIAIMLPLALVAARQWKALGSAAVSACVLALASAAIFGPDAWQSWWTMISSGGVGLSSSVATGRLHGSSVFTCAILFGATPFIASLLQAAATLLAGVSVYIGWRRPMPDALRIAVLATATVLGAPHVTGYDAILSAFAAALLFGECLKSGSGPAEWLIAWIAWVIPLVNPPMFHPLGRLTPLFDALLIAAILARGLGAARVSRASKDDRANTRSVEPDPIPSRG
jgi:Glycosyltransferase family 87